MTVSFLFLILNYLLLGATYLYRFFNPGDGSSNWLQKSGLTSYFVFALILLTIFVVSFFNVAWEEIDTYELAFFILVALFAIYKIFIPAIEFIHKRVAFMFTPLDGILFMAAIIQESFVLVNMTIHNPGAFGFVYLWTILSIIPMVFGSFYLGRFIEKKFIYFDNEHRNYFSKKNLSLISSPSLNLAMGLSFCLWMMLKAIIYFVYGF